MRYTNIEKATFLDRPNRFIAQIQLSGRDVRCHVKNTGRCRELLIPGAEVYVQHREQRERKTAYDLIAVRKGERLINLDSTAANHVFHEFLASGGLGFRAERIHPEYTHGDSRFDFYLEDGGRRIFAEVKGVTLEEDGVVRFPDAPTERGVKHLRGLAQAVKDGYLVDFISVETTLKFIQEGIVYDELSEEDREAYEDTFEDENGELPESIASSALNEWIFNEDTIREVLRILMKEGLKIDYGNKIGKSIIFAKNHKHAEEILKNFGKEFPHLPGWAKVIDNYMTYAQSAIDEFSEPDKLPQIAISVDMLDTGIDVPEVLNLVFFKKVMSKAKFWQMIGRGTRLCPGLIDGEDKNKFYIFDFCGNFEFFRMNKGKANNNTLALSAMLFSLKAQIVYKLQDMAYQTEELIAFRKSLVQELLEKVQELDRENFAVKQHLKYVELYSDPESYKALTYEDTLVMTDELAPLVLPDPDDAKALRFDALLYGIELAYLAGKKYAKARHDLISKVQAVAGVANIPEIMAQQELIQKILKTDYLENAGINEFENIRENIRDLIKYIPNKQVVYNTNFDDEILSMTFHESELENDYLADYKAKAEYYVRQHQENEAIAKLKSNIPLTEDDVAELERILWSEVGTKQDYEREIGSVPLGEFVRSVIGLDMTAAKAAFADYLDSTQLDSRQIYFVNQIVEYIVHNGMMKDLSVLQDSPFTDQGSIVEVFTDLSVWAGIRKAIERVNANATVA